ncbi:PQQ-binding-like beta-propeller repeat protein [Halorubellus sp. PRR65]|uniref:outer membrane protein assembly factor BamB family protein n=1 Tax=Halorubellus sp. PRR65 TaxID=3098148 RepID=UPI002B263C88|nr:PQQ-binding-like beta-propeller repeat protein [Halorubellus sp. PRR65]
MKRRGVLAAVLATSGCLRLSGSTTERTERATGETTGGIEEPATRTTTTDTASDDGVETSEAPGAWGQLGYDATNAGFVDAKPVDRPVYTEWTREFDIETPYAPVVDGDRVYLIGERETDAGVVRTLDATTGEDVWRTTVDGWPSCQPAVADGTVYAGVGSTLYAFDAEDGRVVWQSPPDTRVSGVYAVTVHDGVVYVGTGSGEATVYAFDAEDGALQWTNAVPGVATTPAVGEEVVLTSYHEVAADVRRLRGIDASSGETAWEYAFEAGGRTESAPAVVDGTAYLGVESGAIVAVDATDGSERWRTVVDAVEAGCSVGPAHAFVATRSAGTGESPNRGVRALDRETGETVWRSGSISRLRTESPVAVVGDVLYGVDHAGGVHALDRETGEARWQLTTNAGSLSAPAVAGGRVYATGERGCVAVATREVNE